MPKEKFNVTLVRGWPASICQRRKKRAPPGRSRGLVAWTMAISTGPTRSSMWATECDPTSSMMFWGSLSIQRSNGPACNWSSPLFHVIVISSGLPSLPELRSFFRHSIDRREQKVVANADFDSL